MKVLWKVFCAFYTIFFTFRAFEEFMVDNPWYLLYMLFAAGYVAFLFEKK